MTATLLKRPPQRLFYFTADIGRMAVVRRDGGIFFQTPVGDQSGILLWSDLDAASAYQIGLTGRPAVPDMHPADITSLPQGTITIPIQ